jgi:hypothetical protein
MIGNPNTSRREAYRKALEERAKRIAAKVPPRPAQVRPMTFEQFCAHRYAP